METGAKFTISTGITLTITGGFEAGMYQVFSCAGTAKVLLAGTRYPEWWGAVGDATTAGVGTDDTAAINAAAQSGEGRVVITNLHKIVQDVDAAVINLDGCSNVEIVGAKPGAGFVNGVEIDTATATWYMLGISGNASPVSNIRIEGLSLYGNISSSTYDPTYQHRHGIAFASPASEITDVTIEDCYVENVNGDAYYVGAGCKRFIVKGNRYKDALRQGICVAGVTSSEDILIQGNIEEYPTKIDTAGVGTPGGSSIHIEPGSGSSSFNRISIIGNIARHGIVSSAYTDATPIVDLVIADNIVDGFIITNRTTNLVCTGNIVTENTDADLMAGISETHIMVHRQVVGGVISGNVITGLTADFGGMANYLSGTGALSLTVYRNIVISNNRITCLGTSKSGILVTNINGATVSGNIIDAVYHGIYNQNSMNTTYIGNTVRSSASNGFIGTNANTTLAYRGRVVIIGNALDGPTGGKHDLTLTGIRYVAAKNQLNNRTNSIGATCQAWPVDDGHGIGSIFREAIPDYGVWQKGDRRYLQTVSPSGTEGAICTTAGANSLGAWAGGTTYYIGDFVDDGAGNYYESLQNANLAHAVTDTDWWVARGAVAAVWKALGVIAA